MVPLNCSFVVFSVQVNDQPISIPGRFRPMIAQTSVPIAAVRHHLGVCEMGEVAVLPAKLRSGRDIAGDQVSALKVFPMERHAGTQIVVPDRYGDGNPGLTAENLSIRNIEPVDRHLEKFNLGAGIDCNVAECDGGADLPS